MESLIATAARALESGFRCQGRRIMFCDSELARLERPEVHNHPPVTGEMAVWVTAWPAAPKLRGQTGE